MDPVTHLLIGANIAGLSGHNISVSDPLFLGPAIASVAPDLDIIMQLRGDLAYLRNHRGISHSIPGLLLISAAITSVLYFLFGSSTPWIYLFAWTTLGSLSHSLLDLLNSYGVKILWPLNPKKFTYSLLSFVDWVILFNAATSLIIGTYNIIAYRLFFAFFAAYTVLRFLMAMNIRWYLKEHFSTGDPLEKLVILPSTFKITKWDFLIETNQFFVLGEIHPFSFSTSVHQKIKKVKDNPFIKAALNNSKLGKFFKEFTPHFYVLHQKESQKHIVRFLDLRYHSNHGFMHTGTIAFDENCRPIEEILQPYSKNKKIKLA